jgi:micrococcal nuclease
MPRFHMQGHEYRYVGRVLRVIDGDTIDVEIDLGFSIRLQQRVRVLGSLGGIDTAELNAVDPGLRALAQAAKVRAVSLCPVGSLVKLRTEQDKMDGFKRYLAEVILADNRSLGNILLAEGLAVTWGKQG